MRDRERGVGEGREVAISRETDRHRWDIQKDRETDLGTDGVCRLNIFLKTLTRKCEKLGKQKISKHAKDSKERFLFGQYTAECKFSR